MWILDELILPLDVVMEPSGSKSAAPPDGCFVVRRDGTATPAFTVRPPMVSLIDGFRTPRKLIDAVVELSEERGVDPEETLEEVFPLFEELLRAGLLRPAAAPAVSRSQPATGRGSAAPDPFVDAVLGRLARPSALRPGGKPRCGMVSGAAGVALGCAQIAARRRDGALLELADRWARRALDERHAEDAFYLERPGLSERDLGAISPFHTLSGVYAVRALVAHARGDPCVRDSAVAGFITAVGRGSGAEDPERGHAGFDLTLGCAGVLLGAALIRRALGEESSEDLDRLAHHQVRLLERRLRSWGAVGDEGSIGYLGIAHGWGGILYALLAWSRASGEKAAAGVERRLAELAELGEPRGRGLRWPRISPRLFGSAAAPRYLASWCNGAAGLVHLWGLAYRVYGGERYLALAERGAWNSWEEGDPTVARLCCGLSGRAYALLGFYNLTGEEEWLERARRLAAAAARVEHRDVEGPAHSLYRGQLGIAVLLADLENPTTASMPFFELPA